MKTAVCFALLVGIAIAVPTIPHSKRKDNPDERGSYYQGDIELPLPLSLGKNGLIDTKYRWTGGKVPYELQTEDFTTSEVATIKQVMTEYDTQTNGCVQFVERSGEDDYVIIKRAILDDSCHSMVGKQGGSQVINYPDWCIAQYGSVIHEMLHTLGFYHEQSSSDRDDYVTIEYDNIQSSATHNFDKYPDTVITDFGEGYDYDSVMHYSGYAFSANGELTIVTKDAADQDRIGQRVDFSTIDLAKLKAMYNCTS